MYYKMYQQRMHFLKTQTALLNGIREPKHNESLWTTSIPRQKTQINCCNCILPSTHSSLYPTRRAPQSKSNCYPTSSKKSKKNLFITTFQHINNLIDDNTFDSSLQDQAKENIHHFLSSSHDHSFHGLHSLIDETCKDQINVIIQKDRTKSELVQYYHGCCLFPVTSTFKKSCKEWTFLFLA